jgi:hypothetical protein
MHSEQSKLGKNYDRTNFRILVAMHSEQIQLGKNGNWTDFRILATMHSVQSQLGKNCNRANFQLSQQCWLRAEPAPKELRSDKLSNANCLCGFKLSTEQWNLTGFCQPASWCHIVTCFMFPVLCCELFSLEASFTLTQMHAHHTHTHTHTHNTRTTRVVQSN